MCPPYSWASRSQKNNFHVSQENQQTDGLRRLVEEVITKEKTHMSTSVKDQSIEGIAKDTSLSLGQGGAVYVADTTQTDGAFGAIQAVEGAVISTLTASNWTPSTATAIPLPAGSTIFGSFSTFTLTSGKVIAYRNV